MVEELNKILRGAIPVVLLLITVALVLSIGSQVVDTTKVLYDDKDATVSVVNESLTVAVNTVQVLGNPFIVNTTVVVSNSTGNLAQARWWNNATGARFGQIVFNVLDTADGELVNVSYNFVSQNKNAAFNASQDGLSGLATFSDFQPTFAIIVVAVLILALLIMGLVAVGMRVL